MSKFLFSLLLATAAATPALAEPPIDSADVAGPQVRSAPANARAQARSEAQSARSQQQAVRANESPFGSARIERPDPAFGARARIGEPMPDEIGARRGAIESPRPGATLRQLPQPSLEEVQQQQQQQVPDSVRDWRPQQQREIGGAVLGYQRLDARRQAQEARHEAPPAGARPDVPAPPRASGGFAQAPTWHSTWRNDHRYDWRSHRRHHRSLFHLGFYFDPFGWGYQRWGIGWRMWPSYYSTSYWLSDPYMYRLPYAPWPYKWVRYYDDAILVNVYSGQVVDVIRDFFW